MQERFEIFPVGSIKKAGGKTFVHIHEPYKDGLLGLGQFSHILVFFWFHKNDNREGRSALRVHPRGNRNNPLTGVFATRSPVRPNLLGIAACRVVSIQGPVIEVDKIDAFHGTPVIDIKPCLSPGDVEVNLKVAEWVHG
jgi:tRNA-Thr(GGU) m(6)t(6)A37 methyltransferase TsaA